MSEKNKNLPNSYTDKKTKVAAGVAAIAILAGFGAAAKRGVSAENSFHTDIAVPSETQPHIDYTVRAGDTESSIAERFNTDFDNTDYENMLNAQLPKQDQAHRMLHPGEQLNLPPK